MQANIMCMHVYCSIRGNSYGTWYYLQEFLCIRNSMPENCATLKIYEQNIYDKQC